MCPPPLVIGLIISNTKDILQFGSIYIVAEYTSLGLTLQRRDVGMHFYREC